MRPLNNANALVVTELPETTSPIDDQTTVVPVAPAAELTFLVRMVHSRRSERGTPLRICNKPQLI